MAIFKLQKNSVGAKGEKEAQKYLKKQGYKIIDRNWCNENGKRIGEIDIIAMDTATNQTVFVEVKTRKLKRYNESVLPEEQITKSKLNKMNKIAEVYIKENELWDVLWRIDAVSVIFVQNEKKPKIKHIKNIFY
jgi:putative endonuclease